MKKNLLFSLSLVIILLSVSLIITENAESSDQISIMSNKKLSYSQVPSHTVKTSYSNGEYFAIWQDYYYPDERLTDIILKKSNNFMESFNYEKNINETLGYSHYSSTISTYNNCIFLSYYGTGNDENGLFFQKSEDNGNSFSDSMKINGNFGARAGGNPQITVYNDKIYIIFTGSNGKLYFVRSNNNGESFETPTPIIDEIIDYRMVVDIYGSIYIIHYNNMDYNLYLTKSMNQGNSFNNPIEIAPTIQTPRHISMNTDTRGYLYFTWIDYTTGLGYFIKSNDGGLTFSDLKIFDEDSGYDTTARTAISVDQWNGVYIAWSDNRNGDQDVFLSISRDDGQSFGEAIKLNDDLSHTDQRDPSMCCDENGNIFIAWEDERDGETNIYYTRIEAMDHSPRLVGDIPTTYYMDEDEVLSEALVSLDEYFEDDDDNENLEFQVTDELNETFFEPRIEDGDLFFDPIVPNTFGIFNFSLRAIDPGDDGRVPTSDDVNSAWIGISLEVESVDDFPVIIGDLYNDFNSGEIRINVTQDQWYNSTLLYEEVDGEDCTMTVTESNPVFEFDVISGNFSFHPRNQDVGEQRFLVTVSDQNLSATDVWIIFNVSNRNDGPVSLESEKTKTVDEDGSLINIDVSEWFVDPDNDPLSFSISDSDHIDGIIHDGNLLDIIPELNWSGEETLVLTCNDSSFSATVEINVTVNAVNDPPVKLEVELPEIELKEGEEQFVTASSEDNDDRLLTYNWFVDDKLIGTGQTIDLGLPGGTHIVKVTVTDGSGAEASKTFEVEVEGDGEDSGFPVIFIIVIIMAIILIITTIVIFIIIKSKNKDPEVTDRNDQSDEKDSELDSVLGTNDP